MREDISDPRMLAAKADEEICQFSSARSVNTESATSPSSPGFDDSIDANVLSLSLLPMLLHVRLQVLHNLWLRPPVPPTTSAGIIPNVVIRLNIAEPRVPGFRKTS